MNWRRNKVEYRKESAILGMLGAVMFLIGFTLMPNLKIYGMFNPFQIAGFAFVILSLSAPWYRKISKALH